MKYSEHFERFWEAYGQDEGLDAQSKGSKREGYKSWEKACKRWLSEENQTEEHAFCQAVMHGHMLNGRNRKAALKARQFVPRLPHVTTYLNQFRFEAEFNTPTSELAEEGRKRESVCSCGEPAFGRSESGNWICRACDLENWKHERRNTTDPAIRKWLPSEMVKTWPREPGESWWQWSMRVRKEIIKRAPAHSIFKWTPPPPADEEYFATHRDAPRPKRWAE